MNRLGGELITERVDCDIDFEELSDPWIEKIFNHEKGTVSYTHLRAHETPEHMGVRREQ